MKRGGGIQSLGRAPVPEWEEIARAAWPGRLPGRLTQLAGRAQFTVLLIGLVILVLAAWLRWPWLGLAAWTLGAVGEWLATPADTAVGRLLDLVGLRPQLRALLRSILAAAVVFVAASDPWAGLGYVTVVLVLQLAWTAQPVLATWLSRSAPPLRYQPGAAAQPVPFTAHARAYARAVGTPGVLVALEFVLLAKALAAATGWMRPAPDLAIAAAVAVAALGWLAWTALQARTLRAAQQGWADALVLELAANSPGYLVYVSLAARQSKYIVNQWLPVLDGLERNGIVLVREANQLLPLDATRLPVVYAPTTRGVELVTLPSVRVAFYLAYGERNSTLLRDPRLRHVMLAHGDSDKATSASALIRAFDETWVAGRAAVDRFAAAGLDLPATHFAVIGRPQASVLPVGPSGRSPKVLLYAPTFEGYYAQTTHSSLDVLGVELVRRLLGGHPELRVWFRPHPASGVVRPSMLAAIATIEDLLRSAGDGHLVTSDRGLSLNECLAGSDVLVSDISSVTSDYLFTERPIVVCDPDGLPAAQFMAAYPSQASSYLLTPDLDGLDAVLADALGDDSLREARIAMKKHVLGDPEGGPQAAFAANLERLCLS
ncbi:CDP-glycerol glycerophosphotransferase family protein [Propionicimonas sp.]|uniref:CDP-glycerol glycerophosphotransferase family protein n=1 Tax=Propionicimonas sp. TaxID=1955623 RepID=UPI0039E57BD1